MKGIGTAVVAVAAASIVVWMTIDLVMRSTDPLYDIGSVQVIVATAAALLVVVGLAGLFSTRRFDQVFVAGLATGFLVAGVAALFSIGIILLVLGAVLTTVLLRKSESLDRRAIASGASIAAGFLVLTFLFIQPPLVRCTADGVEVTAGGSSVSGSGTEDGESSTGQVVSDGDRFTYECRGGELVRFEIVRSGD